MENEEQKAEDTQEVPGTPAAGDIKDQLGGQIAADPEKPAEAGE